MTKQVVFLVLLGAIIGGGWYASQRWELRLIPRSGERTDHAEHPATAPETTPAAAGPLRTVIRIAALNLAQFDESKFANPRFREIIGQIIGRFDLVAVQGLQGNDQAMAMRLVELAGTPQRQFDFALCDSARNGMLPRYAAFIFDRASIEVDRQTVREIRLATYSPGQFLHKPLIGQFRVLGPDPQEAFTFCLISVDIDPERIREELAMLPDVYRGVRRQCAPEDDVMLLGTLYADAAQWDALKEQLDVTMAITSTPTTTRGTQLADNILFNPQATREFTSRAGVIDLLREFNLSVPEALEISEHLPVWAEFSVYEGGQAGHVNAGGR